MPLTAGRHNRASVHFALTHTRKRNARLKVRYMDPVGGIESLARVIKIRSTYRYGQRSGIEQKTDTLAHVDSKPPVKLDLQAATATMASSHPILGDPGDLRKIAKRHSLVAGDDPARLLPASENTAHGI